LNRPQKVHLHLHGVSAEDVAELLARRDQLLQTGQAGRASRIACRTRLARREDRMGRCRHRDRRYRRVYRCRRGAVASRVQLNVTARQAQQLEREQADKVDLLLGGFTVEMSGTQTPGPGYSRTWMAEIFNGSRRPIRDVACHIEPVPGQGRYLAHQIGELVVWDIPNVAPPIDPKKRSSLIDLKEGSTVELIRAGATFAFLFPFAVKGHPEARASVTFTDDAGLRWQIGHTLHLEKLRPTTRQRWRELMARPDPGH
jgi:hypothetical protein